MEERRDARRPALWGRRGNTGRTCYAFVQRVVKGMVGDQAACVVLEVPPLHDSQRTRGHRCLVGRQAVPEVGALDQGVRLVGDQSPERGGVEVTLLLPHGGMFSVK